MSTVIHTTLSDEDKKKLLAFGKGSLKSGIEHLLNIVDSKKITVEIITEITI